jgi:hypothetical protein
MRQFFEAPLWGSKILPESVVIHVRWRSQHRPNDSGLSALIPMRTDSITVPWVVTSPTLLWAFRDWTGSVSCENKEWLLLTCGTRFSTDRKQVKRSFLKMLCPLGVRPRRPVRCWMRVRTRTLGDIRFGAEVSAKPSNSWTLLSTYLMCMWGTNYRTQNVHIKYMRELFTYFNYISI